MIKKLFLPIVSLVIVIAGTSLKVNANSVQSLAKDCNVENKEAFRYVSEYAKYSTDSEDILYLIVENENIRNLPTDLRQMEGILLSVSRVNGECTAYLREFDFKSGLPTFKSLLPDRADAAKGIVKNYWLNRIQIMGGQKRFLENLSSSGNANHNYNEPIYMNIEDVEALRDLRVDLPGNIIAFPEEPEERLLTMLFSRSIGRERQVLAVNNLAIVDSYSIATIRRNDGEYTLIGSKSQNGIWEIIADYTETYDPLYLSGEFFIPFEIARDLLDKNQPNWRDQVTKEQQ